MIKLKLNSKDSGFELPYAKANVSGGNKIIRRNISKGERGGTVKERWSTNDFQVTISGIIIGEDGIYPKTEVRELLKYLKYNGNIKIINKTLNEMKIIYIAIEKYSLPHTKGDQNQLYSITAYSDELFNQLISS